MRTWNLILTVSLLCAATWVAAAEVEPNAEATEAYNAYVEAYKQGYQYRCREHGEHMLQTQNQHAAKWRGIIGKIALNRPRRHSRILLILLSSRNHRYKKTSAI